MLCKSLCSLERSSQAPTFIHFFSHVRFCSAPLLWHRKYKCYKRKGLKIIQRSEFEPTNRWPKIILRSINIITRAPRYLLKQLLL